MLYTFIFFLLTRDLMPNLNTHPFNFCLARIKARSCKLDAVGEKNMASISAATTPQSHIPVSGPPLVAAPILPLIIQYSTIDPKFMAWHASPLALYVCMHTSVQHAS
jgi:hypothetical protein